MATPTPAEIIAYGTAGAAVVASIGAMITSTIMAFKTNAKVNEVKATSDVIHTNTNNALTELRKEKKLDLSEIEGLKEEILALRDMVLKLADPEGSRTQAEASQVLLPPLVSHHQQPQQAEAGVAAAVPVIVADITPEAAAKIAGSVTDPIPEQKQ